MEYQKADRDYIRLSIAFEGRAKQANELLRNFDSISELFEAVKNFDSDILTMIKREQAEKLRLTASDVYIDDFISDLEKNGVSALTPNSEAYPTELKYIADPPFVLYARGKCAQLQAETPFAIIGARRCSDYGKKVSAHMGCELAKNGVTIVSGLAYGCDSLAAQGALSAAEQKYPTAAILGQGVCTGKNRRHRGDYGSNNRERLRDERIPAFHACCNVFFPNEKQNNQRNELRRACC